MQISSAAKTERIVGIGHRENECRNAEGRAHHIKHKPERDAAERDQASHTALANRPRDQINHIAPRREHHIEGDQCEPDVAGCGQRDILMSLVPIISSACIDLKRHMQYHSWVGGALHHAFDHGDCPIDLTLRYLENKFIVHL
jgi:hypothetical protein